MIGTDFLSAHGGQRDFVGEEVADEVGGGGEEKRHYEPALAAEDRADPEDQHGEQGHEQEGFEVVVEFAVHRNLSLARDSSRAKG